MLMSFLFLKTKSFFDLLMLILFLDQNFFIFVYIFVYAFESYWVFFKSNHIQVMLWHQMKNRFCNFEFKTQRSRQVFMCIPHAYCYTCQMPFSSWGDYFRVILILTSWAISEPIFHSGRRLKGLWVVVTWKFHFSWKKFKKLCS